MKLTASLVDPWCSSPYLYTHEMLLLRVSAERCGGTCWTVNHHNFNFHLDVPEVGAKSGPECLFSHSCRPSAVHAARNTCSLRAKRRLAAGYCTSESLKSSFFFIFSCKMSHIHNVVLVLQNDGVGPRRSRRLVLHNRTLASAPTICCAYTPSALRKMGDPENQDVKEIIQSQHICPEVGSYS